MSLAVVYSRAQFGVKAPLVTVEVHLAGGLPSLSIVGLPETAVRESKDRVRSALLHSGFEFPARRITVNLAPADLPKQGGRYDLAIALGILVASGQVPDETLQHCEFVAELALSGSLRPVHGILPSALTIAKQGRLLVCAAADAEEAVLGAPSSVRSAQHLLEVCAHLQGNKELSIPEAQVQPRVSEPVLDLVDVRGQHQARRALEVAAAGAHNLLLIGPPGTGKTLLAQRLPGILPPLADHEALETAAIASICGAALSTGNWRRRPFRAPHHTASAVALVGGGSNPLPGEISLAHHGVLFLDELPEFRRHALEVLREPLDTGSITISRAAKQAEFPARFQLIAAMNPCPCGYWGDVEGDCRCSQEQIQRYQSRISGPLLDRIDLQIEMSRVSWQQLENDVGEPTATVRERVAAARQHQYARGFLNAYLPVSRLDACCRLSARENQLLAKASKRFRLSARSVHRILKVARSIADLDHSEAVQVHHLQEALGYRCLEKQALTLAGA